MTPLEQITRDEGYRQYPYKDTLGVLTVGIGRNLDRVGISREEAGVMAENDINRCIAGLRQALDFFDGLSGPRQGVLINMAFQMGVRGLLKFTDTLARIERGDFEGAAKAMLNSEWARQTPLRAQRLAEQMRTDIWV